MPIDHLTRTPVPSRESLKAYLDDALITGMVATSRENNRAHYRALADGERYYWLGLDLGDRWTDESRVLSVMAERCGVDPDPSRTNGQDTISSERCVAALDRVAELLRKAVAQRQRVLFATGHPAGMLPVYQDLARALAAAGCEIVLPPGGIKLGGDSGSQDIRRIGAVAVLQERGHLPHTHSPEPMRALLDRLEAGGAELPDLVIADHGWAGAAASRIVPTIGFADCNDPALFLGEAEGSLLVSVPLDDDVEPHLYEPMTAYLLSAAGLTPA
ncbi:phosphatase [Phaeacidiphilus oryzae]|uniref:phosphatase n=1 Tax=Phaeacidiphilus oryzae TaxID=348818 RepID=UPI00056702E0|nr:phosphatase [Phaeacidiphilus oryzae]